MYLNFEVGLILTSGGKLDFKESQAFQFSNYQWAMALIQENSTRHYQQKENQREARIIFSPGLAEILLF